MAKETYLILSEKTWHNNFANKLSCLYKDYKFIHIKNKKYFNVDNLQKISPKKIFIPHWSYIIPQEIYNNFDCVVFHMTDLPYGRGGSPLQNLIVRGHKKTKISALKVEKELDAGDVYLKKNLNLDGTAQNIFYRASEIVLDMIKEIIDKNITPIKQEGEIVKFNRRTPKMSNISDLTSLEQIYDYIRMLDCEGYPKAYIDFGEFRIEFSAADYNKNQIKADVRIFKK